MASIASDDALILPHRANPRGWNFRERQDYKNTQNLAAERWHSYEIEVNGQDYIVRLNGQQATRFQRAATDTRRGNPPSADPNSGFIGLQTHTGNVAFANVRIKTL
jgi:hypothetical protein